MKPRLDLRVRLRPVFEEDTGQPGRLRGPGGRSLLVDRRVGELFRATGTEPLVAELLRTDPEPEIAYAALVVLVLAGAVEASPAPERPEPPPAVGPAASPLVSLVIVSWNSAADLPCLLESIGHQTYPNLEVIVVDNDSSDGSAGVVAAGWPDVEVLRMASNGGFGAAVNAGWDRARGELIAVLNADVELAPGAVAAWVAGALEQPDAAAVAAKMMLGSNPAFINSLGNSVQGGAWGSDNFMGLLDLGQFDGVEEVWSACFGAVLVRRSAIERVGPLDAAYFLYYEDLDWSYRARLAGYSIVTAPGCIVRHQFGSSVSSRPALFKLRLVVRNRIRYVMLNMSWRLIAHYLPGYLYQDLRQVVKAIVTRNPHALRTYLRAYGELVRELPRWPALRRRRRSGARGDERRALALNIEPAAAAQQGAEAVVSEPVIRAWYLDLIPLPESAAVQVSRRRR